MIQLPIVTQWSIFTPTVYRMLERKYVDSFFETGEINLSSFLAFSKHTDEERKDKEGNNILCGRGDKSTVYASVENGDDAFVLCGTSAKPSKELLASFGCDAAIQIFNTTGFGSVLSRYVPGIRQGCEGYCYYTDSAIECKLGDFELEQLQKNPEDKKLSLNKLGGLILNMAGQAVFFRKKVIFCHQLEYRWVWITGRHQEHNLTIIAPEAREFCLPYYPDE